MHSLQFFPMSITVIQLLFFDLLILESDKKV